MNVLIDLSSTQNQYGMKINGGGEYSFAVFCALVKKNVAKCTVLLNRDWGDNDKVVLFCKGNNIDIIYFDSINHINDIVNEVLPDKFFIPVFYSKYSELKVNDNIQLITVIHDLCELYYKRLPVKYGKYTDGFFVNFLRRIKDYIILHKYENDVILRHNKLINLSSNQIIITDSYYSKSSILRYLDIDDPNRIKVFYVPNKEVIIRDRSSIDCFGLHYKKYFMLCAGNRWAKNNAIVLKVIDEMFSKSKYDSILDGFKVILVGTDKKYKNFYGKFLIHKERFVFDDYVSDSDMETLYSGSYMFIFPSMLEGFGMPPIEALQHNALVACSTSMSIPEVCGASVTYFDPTDEISIELAILRLFDPGFINMLNDYSDFEMKLLSEKRDSDLSKIIDLIIE